jgi:hypothetical protein
MINALPFRVRENQKPTTVKSSVQALREESSQTPFRASADGSKVVVMIF